MVNTGSAKSIVWPDHTVTIQVTDTESWTQGRPQCISGWFKISLLALSTVELADRQDINTWKSGIQVTDFRQLL